MGLYHRGENERVVEWITGIPWSRNCPQFLETKDNQTMQACPSAGHHFASLVDLEQIRSASISTRAASTHIDNVLDRAMALESHVVDRRQQR